MIHLILAVISLIVFFIFSVIMIPVEWVVGKFSVQAKDTSRRKIVQAYCRILLFLCGTKVTIIGKDRIPDGPVLYTPNHRSAFDILLLLAYSPTAVCFIAKKEWEKVPLLSWWINWLHGLYLDRENIREGLKTILAAIDMVKQGTSVCIFPEGTRGRGSDERELQPFHEGSFKIAVKPGCPVIPVALCHTSEILEDHAPLIRSVHVTMEYGEPIDPGALEGEDKKFIGRYVQGIVQQMINANH